MLKHAPAAFRRVLERGEPMKFQNEYISTSLTPREREVLSDYVDGGESLWITRYFRGTHMDELSDAEKKELRGNARMLNRAIRRAPVSSTSFVLFRAVSQDLPKQQFYKARDAADFINRGIISTSISYASASTFLEPDEKCCMLVILVPKGTLMLQVLDHSAWAEEKEIMLPHGNEFRIAKTCMIDGVRHMYCYLAKQPPVNTAAVR